MERYKQRLMGNYSGSSAIRMPIGKTKLIRFQRRKKTIGNLTRGHSCYILAKNLSLFYPCSDTLYETEFRGDGLNNLAENISRKYSIQAVAWILPSVFNQIYCDNQE